MSLQDKNIGMEKTGSEKDIGVIISSNLKPADQCNRAANKANQMLGQLKRSFTYRDPTIWTRLFKTFVRPKLEYCVPAWRPWLKKDFNKLERVQRRAVKMIQGLKGKTYEEKLKELGLMTDESGGEKKKGGHDCLLQDLKWIGRHRQRKVF